MLVLTRKPGNSIIMKAGEELIKFTVLNVQNKFVRVGIDAPDDVSIDREEIFLKKLKDGSITLNGNIKQKEDEGRIS